MAGAVRRDMAEDAEGLPGRAGLFAEGLMAGAFPWRGVIVADKGVCGGATGRQFAHRGADDGSVIRRDTRGPGAIERRIRVEIDDRHGAEEARRQVPTANGAFDDAAHGPMCRQEGLQFVGARIAFRNGHGLPAVRGGVAAYSGQFHLLDELPWHHVEIEDGRT